MAIKTTETIKDAIISTIQGLKPTVTTRIGSVVRDVFITPISQVLGNFYTEVDRVSDSQSPLTAEDEDLVRLGENFMVFRRGATKSRGSVKFFTPTLPTSDITIPIGTVVATRANSNRQVYRFLTVQTGVIYSAYAANYYNSDTGNYEITVGVESEREGEEFNVSAGTVKTLIDSISGISGVTNDSAMTGGSDEESISSVKDRILAKLTGTYVGTSNGYYTNITEVTGVEDVLVVGSESANMTRKYAGGVDIYVKGIIPTEVTETHIINSSVPPDLVVNRQPVLDSYEGTIVSSTLGALVYGTDWEWSKDTGVLANSVNALDKIHWLTSSTDLGTITVTYSFNSLIRDVQNFVESASQKTISADVLAKWSSPLSVNVEYRIRVLSGYSSATVSTNTETAVTNLLSGYTLGQEVQQSDIISTINAVAGVDDVISPLDVLEDNDGVISQDSDGNLDIPYNQYAVANSVTATVI